MNERLQSVLAQRDVSPEALAEACKVDPKTVGRWLGGRTPHPQHRFKVARHLRVEEAFLWPTVLPRTRQRVVSSMELLGTYTNRASVPREMWLDLLQGARERIELLVFSGTFFAQTNPHAAKMLAERATEGVQMRLCFGDPNGQAVALRGREEGIGDTLAAKIRASLTYYRALPAEAGCEVRLHDTTLYSSLFRYDDTLLVNPHVYGQPASANPLLHMKKTSDGGWFDQYAQSFEAVWGSAKAWTPDVEGTTTHG